jgi:hypothetical protein
MRKDIEEKLADVSKTPHWKLLKEVLWQEIEHICDYEKAESFEEFIAFRTTRKIFKEFVRKVEGAKEALTFIA